jgi:hypothetical protein
VTAKKLLIGACIGLALILVFTTAGVRAECCYYYNPLFLPFAVAGAVLGTAAAIVTAPFAYSPYYGPGYYTPAPVYYDPGPYRGGAVRVRSHYDRDGFWVPGHYNRFGNWIPGHYR